jgi:hypothetical protein
MVICYSEAAKHSDPVVCSSTKEGNLDLFTETPAEIFLVYNLSERIEHGYISRFYSTTDSRI